MIFRALFFSLFLSYVALHGSAQQCSRNDLCKNNLCCSQHGYCGSSDEFCLPGNCVSYCDPDIKGCDTGGGGNVDISGGVADILTREMFAEMFPHKDEPSCHAVGFFTYDAFIAASKSFPAFATTGNETVRRREVCAFLGQTSHETSGGMGWTPPDSPFNWGYCWKEEINKAEYCDWNNVQYPCVAGQQYFGRGPIQLSWNYNYGQCGDAIGQPLLQIPRLLACNSTMSFEAALWFWMTPQSPKPSCHEVMVDEWTPSAADKAAGRAPGYGLCTNIINGGCECGQGSNAAGEDRIGFYKRYCSMLGVDPGDNLDCYNQQPWGSCGGLTKPAVESI